MSSLSIAKSRNAKSAGSKKVSAKSTAPSRRKITPGAANAKTLSKADPHPPQSASSTPHQIKRESYHPSRFHTLIHQPLLRAQAALDGRLRFQAYGGCSARVVRTLSQ
jgi:hypothetical protein